MIVFTLQTAVHVKMRVESAAWLFHSVGLVAKCNVHHHKCNIYIILSHIFVARSAVDTGGHPAVTYRDTPYNTHGEEKDTVSRIKTGLIAVVYLRELLIL